MRAGRLDTMACVPTAERLDPIDPIDPISVPGEYHARNRPCHGTPAALLAWMPAVSHAGWYEVVNYTGTCGPV